MIQNRSWPSEVVPNGWASEGPRSTGTTWRSVGSYGETTDSSVNASVASSSTAPTVTAGLNRSRSVIAVTVARGRPGTAGAVTIAWLNRPPLLLVANPRVEQRVGEVDQQGRRRDAHDREQRHPQDQVVVGLEDGGEQPVADAGVGERHLRDERGLEHRPDLPAGATRTRSAGRPRACPAPAPAATRGPC